MGTETHTSSMAKSCANRKWASKGKRTSLRSWETHGFPPTLADSGLLFLHGRVSLPLPTPPLVRFPLGTQPMLRAEHQNIKTELGAWVEDVRTCLIALAG